MNPSITDRVVSIFAYFTFGIFSVIWILFAHVIKKPISPFLAFNLYQAIFISICLSIISLIFSIAINLISIVPILGPFVRALDIYINQTPVYFTFTLSGLIITIMVLYLSIMSLLGIKPYVPIASETINANFGG